MEEGAQSAAQLTAQDIRLIHSLADFEQANSALVFIDELDPDEKMSRVELRRYRCIEDAAVVAYWRPFSECRGLPKLSLKRLGLKLTAEEAALHEILKTHRNKVVAHTDIDRMRLAFRSWKPSDHDVIMPHLIRDDALALFDRRQEWRALVRKLLNAVADSVFERVQGLGEAEFLFVPDA